MSMPKPFARFSILLIIFGSLPCEALVSYEGFLDAYFAYDFNHPRGAIRPYTTQPLRQSEPNINLAFGGFRIEKKNWRGRIALQGGNSVEANTTLETSDLKYIQESYLGMKIGEKTWVDGGIYLGHIGGESWISRDNWTYTRSLSSDYTPYYATGVRITHENFQIHFMNGWQNIREDNQAKAVGLQYNYRKFFTYNNFFGDEEVTGPRPRFRGHHNFIFRGENILGTFDVGHQAQRNSSGTDLWWSVSLTRRYEIGETRSMAVRFEHYADPHEANVRTFTPDGFRVTSASVNFDQRLPREILWRTELRGFHSHDRIYPESSGKLSRYDGFLVTSLSVLLK